MTLYRRIYVSLVVISIIGFVYVAHLVQRPCYRWDFFYDTARDLIRIATFMSFLYAVMAPMRLKRKLAVAAVIPLIVHVAGTFYINNAVNTYCSPY